MTLKEQIAQRQADHAALMEYIKAEFVKGVDYGSLKRKQGLTKPCLFKAGAEKVCNALGLVARFPNFGEYEKAIMTGMIIESIIIRCELRNEEGCVVAEGIGGRKTSQDDGDLNKSLKMATKSAFIDATLRGASLSSSFTQDLDDVNSTATPPKELPVYSDVDFATYLPSWQKMIADGARTRDQIIATISCKYRLTEEQIKRI